MAESSEREISRVLEEIDSRLSRLEESVSHVAIEEFRERIKELEDLQMLLQAEMLQLRQKLFGEVEQLPIYDIDKRLSELEKIIKEGVPVQVSEDLEKRVERIEKIKDVKEVAKKLEEFEKRISKLRPEKIDIPELKKLREVFSRIEVIENKIGKMEEKFEKEIKEIEDLVASSGKILTEPAMKKYIERLERVKKEIEDKVEEVNYLKEKLDESIKEREDVVKKIEGLENAIAQGDAIVAKLRAQAEQARAGVEKLETLRESIESVIKDRIGELEILKEDIYNKLNKTNERILAEIEKSEALRDEMSAKSAIIEKRLSRMESIGKSFEKWKGEFASEIEKRFLLRTEIEEIINRMKTEMGNVKSDVYATVNTINEQVRKEMENLRKKEREFVTKSDVERICSELEDRIEREAERISKASMKNEKEIERITKAGEEVYKRIEELEKLVGSINFKLEEKTKNHEERFSEIGKRFAGFGSRIDAIRSELESRMERETQRIEEKITKNEKEIERITKAGTELSKRIEELEKLTSIVNSKLEKKINADEKRFSEIGKRFAEFESRINAKVEEKLNTASNETRKSLESMRDWVKKETEKLNEYVINTGKKTLENKDEIEQISREIEGIRSEVYRVERESVARLTKIEQRIDRIRDDALKLLNEHLSKFSALVETKFLKKTEFSEFRKKIREETSDEVARSIRVSQQFAIEPILQRISMIEHQIIEIRKVLRSIAGKLPVVVE